jgi:hypothetical protein
MHGRASVVERRTNAAVPHRYEVTSPNGKHSRVTTLGFSTSRSLPWSMYSGSIVMVLTCLSRPPEQYSTDTTSRLELHADFKAIKPKERQSSFSTRNSFTTRYQCCCPESSRAPRTPSSAEDWNEVPKPQATFPIEHVRIPLYVFVPRASFDPLVLG